MTCPETPRHLFGGGRASSTAILSQEQWAELYITYDEYLQSLAAGFTRLCRTDAEDLAQDFQITRMQGLVAHFNPNHNVDRPTRFRSLLKSAFTRFVIDRVRRKTRECKHLHRLAVERAAQVDRAHEEQEARRDKDVRSDRLAEVEALASVVMCRFFRAYDLTLREGKPLKEASATLGISMAAVHYQRSRVIEFMRENIKRD